MDEKIEQEFRDQRKVLGKLNSGTKVDGAQIDRNK